MKKKLMIRIQIRAFTYTMLTAIWFWCTILELNPGLQVNDVNGSDLDLFISLVAIA